MDQQPERVAEFKAEIESMRLRGSSASAERALLVVGVVALVAGLGLAVLGGIQVTGTSDPGDQRVFMATGTFLGLALVIVGAALFLRFSLSRYLRFWMIRLVHEERANTDRLIAALGSSDATDDPT